LAREGVDDFGGHQSNPQTPQRKEAMNWHKLSDEKPPKDGWYHVYTPDYPEDFQRYDIALWLGVQQRFASLDHDDFPSHWAELEPPE
jgi:hypothetical protein